MSAQAQRWRESGKERTRNAIVGARLTLVLGGARSGKSRYAEALITALPPPWIYAATGQAFDAEMAERIAAHQARRSAGWTTVETPRDLAATLAAHAGAPILVDCLTLWLSNLMMAEAAIEAQFDGLEQALARAAAPVVLVANEVGSGIVPDNPLARRFRDLQGWLNQRIAAQADRVILLVAGLPLFVKGNPKE
jgi:adenosylcobinamide kinase/adenosylcobinamide-phosphate guanylyltransferase